MYKLEPVSIRPSDLPTDELLIEATRRGDDRAFECLYERYLPRVTAYVNSMVRDHARAEDIAQDAFVSALRRMRETDRPISFKAWIHEIAKNAAIDHFRKVSRAGEVPIAGEALGPAEKRLLAGGGPERAVEDRRSLELLKDAFSGLSDVHHQILVLREFEGLSYGEIGQRLGLTKSAVESTLFRARRRLTEEYEDISSGERCRRMLVALAAAAEGVQLGRELRKLERHLGRCRHCRRQAVAMGVGALVPKRTTLRERVAALLPVPFLPRRGSSGQAAASGQPGAAASSSLSQYGGSLLPMAEQGSQLAKAAAVVTAAALVGAGSAAVVQHHRIATPAPRVAPKIGSSVSDRFRTGVSDATHAIRMFPGRSGSSVGGQLGGARDPGAGRGSGGRAQSPRGPFGGRDSGDGQQLGGSGEHRLPVGDGRWRKRFDQGTGRASAGYGMGGQSGSSGDGSRLKEGLTAVEQGVRDGIQPPPGTPGSGRATNDGPPPGGGDPPPLPPAPTVHDIKETLGLGDGSSCTPSRGHPCPQP